MEEGRVLVQIDVMKLQGVNACVMMLEKNGVNCKIRCPVLL